MLMRRAARNGFLASMAIGALVGIPLFAMSFSERNSLAVSSLAFEIFLAAFALCGAALSSQSLTVRLGLGPSRISWPTLALLVAGMLSLSFALDGIYNLVGFEESSSLSDFESYLAGIRGWSLGLAVLSFAVAPGVAEELLCRGLVQRGLLARVGPFSSIVLAAAFFGALHLEPVHGVLAAILGLYLGSVAQLTGSIRASIACHIINNAVAVAGAALVIEVAAIGPATIVLASVFSLGALVWARRIITRSCRSDALLRSPD